MEITINFTQADKELADKLRELAREHKGTLFIDNEEFEDFRN